MDQIAEFSHLFDYDAWANRRWLDALADKGWPEPDRAVFTHILAASDIWLQRVNGASPAEMPTPEPSAATIATLSREWKVALKHRPGDLMVFYKRTTGEPLHLPLSAIVRHLLNHGTYHRGELRGLCRSRGDDAFPETDYALFEISIGAAE
ncbi:MAG: hypothetical protein KGJ62_01365 [Armatimonadetes bacterium]|nr:hypothetical protein [Armatimonadota bacterium]MDE2205846.1 hypothetical protein [Armatimonadota bacterium]